MENDLEDIVELSLLNASLENVTEYVIGKIKEESELKTRLMRAMALADLDDKASFDNKLIRLYKISDETGRKEIELYNQVEAQLKMSKMKREQIEEAINSKKKVIDIRPR